MMTRIPGSCNRFDGYHLIIQGKNDNNSTCSVSFQDYMYSPNLTKREIDTVYCPCFVVERDLVKEIVILARH